MRKLTEEEKQERGLNDKPSFSIFGFYVSRTDWKRLWQFERRQLEKILPYANDLKQRLAKYEHHKTQPRVNGKFAKRPDPIVEEANKPMCYETLRKAGK